MKKLASQRGQAMVQVLALAQVPRKKGM